MTTSAQGQPFITIIGDGQLARMMHTEAIELGFPIRVLAGATDSSAASVTAQVMLGDYTNYDDLVKAAEGVAVMSFDHEHVPNEHLHALIKAGINVQPRPSALVYAQDKLLMRERLAALGAPVPEFAPIDTVADAEEFWLRVSGQVCLKARRGGYDGHGVWFPDSKEELIALVEELLAKGTPLMGERKVELVRELSAMVARAPGGETAAWPVVESVQTDGICTETIAPAPGLNADLDQQMRVLAQNIATDLGVTGVLAVELFETRDEDDRPLILVNELAMRPHNTGHWTQDGCVTSQFEQHLRAILDWPLGSTQTTAPYTVMANTLGADSEPDLPIPARMAEVWARYPQAKIHLYDKAHRAGRKLGHVNVSGEDPEETRAIARACAHMIIHGTWPNENEKES